METIIQSLRILQLKTRQYNKPFDFWAFETTQGAVVFGVMFAIVFLNLLLLFGL